MTARRARFFCVAAAAAAFLGGHPAAAQTADDFFDAHTVNRLDLLVNSRDWERLRASFEQDTYYPADLRWRGLTIRNAGIRSRGNGSRSGDKPGLRVDINRYAPAQDFLGLKSFVLDNLTQDPSGMREWLAMRIYARSGLPAPRVAHVELYVNNAFAGLYAVVEAVDKDFLRRVFGPNATGTENDGYLFDFEYRYDWRFTHLGSDLNAYAALFDPVTHERAPAVELYEPIEAMLRAINHARGQDFVASVSPYLDLARLMKLLGVQSFVAEWDGVLGYAGANNFYLYRFEGSLRSQLIPWDADNAFRAVDYSLTAGHTENVLMRRAMQVPELSAAYYRAVLEAASLTGVEEEIVAQWNRIGLVLERDPLKPFTNEEVRAAVADLVLFARERPRFVREALTSPAGPAAAGSVPRAAAFPSRPR